MGHLKALKIVKVLFEGLVIHKLWYINELRLMCLFESFLSILLCFHVQVHQMVVHNLECRKVKNLKSNT